MQWFNYELVARVTFHYYQAGLDVSITITVFHFVHACPCLMHKSTNANARYITVIIWRVALLVRRCFIDKQRFNNTAVEATTVCPYQSYFQYNSPTPISTSCTF